MGVMLMSDKERSRKAIFEMVRQRRITLLQASVQCHLSYRQALRVYKSYIEKGDAGLIHQHRGQRSNRKHPHQEDIIALYKSKYEGFGPTLASEYLLEEDNLIVNRETLRQWLLKEGLWTRQRKRSPYRKRREPCAQFGELVQIDGSIHDWIGTGEHSCLLNMVDDATGKTLSQLDTGETTRVVFSVLWDWIEKYGVPLALYVDLKNVYVSPKKDSFSHVQVACNKLGIRIIKARSPQAKGRVERNHAVYQDRFVKELRLRKVKSIDRANQILKSTFIDKLNYKFEKNPKKKESAHIPLGSIDLNQVLCWQYERVMQNDWTFSFSSQIFQVEKSYGDKIKPSASITVRKHLDGSISAWYNNEELKITKINRRVIKRKAPSTKACRRYSNIRTNWYKTNAFLFEESLEVKNDNLLRKSTR